VNQIELWNPECHIQVSVFKYVVQFLQQTIHWWRHDPYSCLIKRISSGTTWNRHLWSCFLLWRDVF